MILLELNNYSARTRDVSYVSNLGLFFFLFFSLVDFYNGKRRSPPDIINNRYSAQLRREAFANRRRRGPRSMLNGELGQRVVRLLEILISKCPFASRVLFYRRLLPKSSLTMPLCKFPFCPYIDTLQITHYDISLTNRCFLFVAGKRVD